MRSSARPRRRSCCPLRERIAAAIDSGEEGDTGGLVERIGARFREWKNQSLEDALGDVLAVAWSRGVYDAVPDGAVLRWIPFDRGPLRRLRRQRARADGQGLAVPDRAGASARAPGLPVPARARPMSSAASQRTRDRALIDRRAPVSSGQHITSARCGFPRCESRRRSFGIRGWLIGAAVVLVVLLLSLRGLARFYTDYLWFKEVGFAHTWRALIEAKAVPGPDLLGASSSSLMFVDLIVADRLAPRYARRPGPKTRSSSATAASSSRTRAASASRVAVVLRDRDGRAASRRSGTTGSCSRNSTQVRRSRTRSSTRTSASTCSGCRSCSSSRAGRSRRCSSS